MLFRSISMYIAVDLGMLALGHKIVFLYACNMHGPGAAVGTARRTDTSIGFAETAYLFTDKRSVEFDGIHGFVQTWVEACTGWVDVLVGYCCALESSCSLRTATAWLLVYIEKMARMSRGLQGRRWINWMLAYEFFSCSLPFTYCIHDRYPILTSLAVPIA